MFNSIKDQQKSLVELINAIESVSIGQDSTKFCVTSVISQIRINGINLVVPLDKMLF